MSFSESLSEAGQNPQSRCLALAEKIISSLNDPDLVRRYFSLKTKLFEGQTPSPTKSDELSTDKAYSFYQTLAEENQRLKDEISKLSMAKPEFTDASENEAIAAKIRELQKAILPNQSLPPKGDAFQELESLKAVVEAKLDSLNFVRDKLRAQNQRLNNEFREVEKTMNAKIEAARQKEEAEKLEIEEQEKQLDQELQKAEGALEAARERLRTAKDENSKLRQQYSDTKALLEGIESEERETEQKIEQMESESESLFEEIEALKVELSKKTRELNALQTLQKFGVEGSGDDNEISEEIERLTRKAEALRTENAQMMFELKRIEKKQSSGSLGSGDAASLDEDELAAQILKSKLQ